MWHNVPAIYIRGTLWGSDQQIICYVTSTTKMAAPRPQMKSSILEKPLSKGKAEVNII